MKIKISLASMNGRGHIASIEGGIVFTGELDIAGSETASAKRACLSASAALRQAAERFELLAHEAHPRLASVQTRINRTRLPKP